MSKWHFLMESYHLIIYFNIINLIQFIQSSVEAQHIRWSHPLVSVCSEWLTTQSIKSWHFPPHVTWSAKLTSAPLCSSISAIDTCPFQLALMSGVSPYWYGRGVQCRHEYTVRWWGGGRWSIVAWIHHRVNVDVLPYKMQYHTSRGRCLELGGTGRGEGGDRGGNIHFWWIGLSTILSIQKPVAETSGCVAPTQSF